MPFLLLSPQLGIVLESLFWYAQDSVGFVTRLKDLFRIRIFAYVGVPFPGKFFPSALYLFRSRSRFNTKSRVIVFNTLLAPFLPGPPLSFTTLVAPAFFLSLSPSFLLFVTSTLPLAALCLNFLLSAPLPFPLLAKSILPRLAKNLILVDVSLLLPLLPLPTY